MCIYIYMEFVDQVQSGSEKCTCVYIYMEFVGQVQYDSEKCVCVYYIYMEFVGQMQYGSENCICAYPYIWSSWVRCSQALRNVYVNITYT